MFIMSTANWGHMKKHLHRYCLNNVEGVFGYVHCFSDMNRQRCSFFKNN